MGRVLAYRRVSTQEQAQEGFSLAAQLERIEAFVRSQSWVLHEVYTDDGYSAKDMDRPALKRLIQDLRPGDIVVVYRLDRLTRSVIDLHSLLRLFEERQVSFRSVTEVYDTTTAMGRLFITLVAAMAQWERENLAERVQMGMREAVKQGKWMGGPRPFGYVPLDGILVPHPEEAPVYREIVRRYLAGAGARGIALWLESQGIKPQRGKVWRHKQILYLLRNPVYVGDTVYGKHKWQGKKLVRGEDTIVVPNTHEPLISREEWMRIQQTLEQRTTLPPRIAGAPYPLAGLARCAKCGRSMRYNRERRQGSKTVYHQYYCNGIVHKECDTKRHHGPTLERAVLDVLIRLADRSILEERVRQRVEATAVSIGPTREEIERQIAKVKAELNRLDQDYRSGELTAKTHARLAGPLEEELDRLQQILDSIPATPVQADLDVSAIANTISSIVSVWEKATGEEKRELLRSVFKTIWVHPDGTVEPELLA